MRQNSHEAGYIHYPRICCHTESSALFLISHRLFNSQRYNYFQKRKANKQITLPCTKQTHRQIACQYHIKPHQALRRLPATGAFVVRQQPIHHMPYVNGTAINYLIPRFSDSHKCQLLAIQPCSSLCQRFRFALESLGLHKVISHLNELYHTTLLADHEINLFAAACRFVIKL